MREMGKQECGCKPDLLIFKDGEEQRKMEQKRTRVVDGQ